jgi:hypothetical protein
MPPVIITSRHARTSQTTSPNVGRSKRRSVARRFGWGELLAAKGAADG